MIEKKMRRGPAILALIQAGRRHMRNRKGWTGEDWRLSDELGIEIGRLPSEATDAHVLEAAERIGGLRYRGGRWVFDCRGRDAVGLAARVLGEAAYIAMRDPEAPDAWDRRRAAFYGTEIGA